ncbi:MAG: two-component system sensor histidine kinase AtoS [Desulfitobacteriaceae bacterium]|nr:two-component system sensor histidine kinase AtoS [Desulfitobacteriaceae bacterium]MDI6880601.1 two-component system sensor histidine kinase AtoS [Desulfitobacteriaceae bacterium]MDI6915228.1 two-component system sensor histidine kinase AtoS [Desulfitobacteriaceae bacterium]
MRFSLRYKLMIILALAVTLPLIGSGYVLIQRAEQALLAEKESKLFGIARILDGALPGDFNSLLSPDLKAASREEKIRQLNRQLAEVTDEVASVYPGVGIGYYSRELDSIITYGPSSEYANLIGQSISLEHKGREVMARGVTMAVQGPMVRGNILNAMIPLQRHGTTIGYVWANELTQSIEKQIQSMETMMYLALSVALLLGLGIVLTLANGVSNSVQRIIEGLRHLHSNLTFRFPEAQGEFGEITLAINGLAQSLSNTRSHTEIIMESIVDGIITIDNAGHVTALNQAASLITGLSKAVIGQRYADLFPEHVQFNSLLLETLHTGQSFVSQEVQFPLPGGGTVPLSVSTSMLRNAENIVGAVVVFKDLTERKVFEDQVRRVDRLAAVGELAAGVAHEIRNPLAAISGSVQVLLEEFPPTHPSRQFGDIVIQEVNRLNSVVEDLLYFSRPSKNYLSTIYPQQLIQETLMLLSPSLHRRSLQLETSFDPREKTISVDSSLIKQVLVNLLLNALQALPEQGGTIRVSTESIGHGVEIAIQDTGSGIAPENVPRIFDPFFTTKDRGTGLGLAVSSKIIEIHRGTIRVQSERDVGSVFSIYLPYEPEGS